MSIHDLSRTGTPVRFNMPFELGLACALKVANPTAYEVFVLDSRPYRMDRTLSDYKGRDPLIHNGTCDGMLTSVLDAFHPAVVHTTTEFRTAMRVLRKSAQLIKRDLKAASLFRPALFYMLVAVATDIAIKRGLIKP
jgi:hypothetical protein